MNKTDEFTHIPVLYKELTEGIEIFSSQNTIVDCTLGLGGHAEGILKKMNNGDIFIGLDADSDNLTRAQERLEKIQTKIKKIFIHTNFIDVGQKLKDCGIEEITAIYYDFGISSVHIDDGDKGFSFSKDAPLDMRLDRSKGQNAKNILNSYTKEQLEKIFSVYGEERYSRKIAQDIEIFRKKKPLETTLELAQIIERISYDPKSKARIFQAVRIEVNNELGSIEKSLQDGIHVLKKGGTIAAISFHSLEDRIVKNIFRSETKDCICEDILCTCHHKKTLEILTKKPIEPTDEEVKSNPRSRSAKLRLAKKL